MRRAKDHSPRKSAKDKKRLQAHTFCAPCAFSRQGLHSLMRFGMNSKDAKSRRGKRNAAFTPVWRLRAFAVHSGFGLRIFLTAIALTGPSLRRRGCDGCAGLGDRTSPIISAWRRAILPPFSFLRQTPPDRRRVASLGAGRGTSCPCQRRRRAPRTRPRRRPAAPRVLRKESG